MKMNKSKLTKKAIVVLSLLLSFTMSAHDVRKLIPLRQEDEGDPSPPGTPIDGYIYILIVFAVVLAGIYFYKSNKVKQVN